MCASPLLLCMETSTDVLSVAVFKGDTVVGLQEYFLPRLHARLITTTVEQLFANLDMSLQELAAIAVASGPGSYTGLRIGTAAAKGLCMALNIPLLAISSLQALAAQVQEPAGLLGARVYALIDARRMEVYAACYSPELQEIVPPHSLIFTPGVFKDELTTGALLFVGSGATKLMPLLTGNTQAYFLPGVQASAKGMGGLTLQQFEQGNWVDLFSYEPYYLKDFATTPPKPNAPQASPRVTN